jgi:hypothetical protein
MSGCTADFPLLVAAAYFKSNFWVLGALAVVALVANAGFIRFALRAKAYHRKLRARLESAQQST